MYTALYRSHRPEDLRRDTWPGARSKNIEESSGLRVCESRISLLRYQRNRQDHYGQDTGKSP